MKTTLLAIAFMLIAITSFAQQKQHPIDKATDSCMASGGYRSADKIDCYNTAYKTWDDEMNKQYKVLYALLDTNGKAKLKISQSNWLKHRDSEIAFLQALYGNKIGIEYQVMHAAAKTEIIRKRALELQQFNAAQNIQI